MQHTHTQVKDGSKDEPEWEERGGGKGGLQPTPRGGPGPADRPLRPFEGPAGGGSSDLYAGDPIPFFGSPEKMTLFNGRNRSTLILPDGISWAAPTGDRPMGRSC